MPKKDETKKTLPKRGASVVKEAVKSGSKVEAKKTSASTKTVAVGKPAQTKATRASAARAATGKAVKTVTRAVKAAASAVAVKAKTATTRRSTIKSATRATTGATKKTTATKKRVSRTPKTLPAFIPDETTIKTQSPTEVREHFFHEHRGPAVAAEPRDLPTEYGDTRIVLLVRDPEWVYAYWEINDATRQELKLPRNGHSKRLVVRMYRVDGRDWPKETAQYFFDIDVGPYANNWYVKLPETDARWASELGMYDDESNYIVICRSNVIQTPRDRMSDDVDSEWMIVEEQFQKIYGVSGGFSLKEMRGSEMLLRQLQKQMLPSLKGEGVGSGAMFSGAQKRPMPTEKQFWMQVQTELILYGATEPDARVTVQGRPVKLRPDGSFTMRFFLPDGEQTLEVHATNRDGDMERKITPIVTKRTK